MSRDAKVDPQKVSAADGATSEKHSGSVPDRTRRTLLKTGAVAVPLIVTLKALPAFAQTDGTASLGTYAYDGGGGEIDPDDDRNWRPVAPNTARPHRRRRDF